jgi:aspartate kinase
LLYLRKFIKVIRVFKFGGASVKDAAGVRNVASIVEKFGGESKLAIVVSAMGKMTNALESLFNLAYHRQDVKESLEGIRNYHYQIADELFFQNPAPVREAIDRYLIRLKFQLLHSPDLSYDQGYDQVVCYGEYLSTLLVYQFFLSRGLTIHLKNARHIIRTDLTWREGEVSFDETQKHIRKEVEPLLKGGIVLTQGFLGGTRTGMVTTLGREGSDYTAALLGHHLNAASVTIWKDVPGVLNADPKWIEGAVLLPELTYQDAAELTYYGATVIHPKTIRPLAQKSIPLFVRSFVDPLKPGTKVGGEAQRSMEPAFIRKENQTLVSFISRDYSFMEEKNSTEVLHLFHQEGLKIQMLQVSATSISVVTDQKKEAMEHIYNHMKTSYSVLFNENLTLITIKNYNDWAISFVRGQNTVILDQRSRHTCQMLLRKNE